MMHGILKIGLCLVSLGVMSCGGNSNTVRDAARESLPGQATPPPAPAVSAPNVPNTASAAVPGALVFHYTCANNCAGSGGDAPGSCPVCGSEYQHNQAFHAQQPQSDPNNPAGTQKLNVQGGGQTTVPPPGTPEPAQNAAGVWHYTCATGCAGGSGAPGTCGTCGGALAHNSAYHQ